MSKPSSVRTLTVSPLEPACPRSAPRPRPLPPPACRGLPRCRCRGADPPRTDRRRSGSRVITSPCNGQVQAAQSRRGGCEKGHEKCGCERAESGAWPHRKRAAAGRARPVADLERSVTRALQTWRRTRLQRPVAVLSPPRNHPHASRSTTFDRHQNNRRKSWARQFQSSIRRWFSALITFICARSHGGADRSPRPGRGGRDRGQRRRRARQQSTPAPAIESAARRPGVRSRLRSPSAGWTVRSTLPRPPAMTVARTRAAPTSRRA